jgi:superfamily II DNA or RNA helicase
MSTSAAHHLSPAFPERAAWGTATKLRAWQEEALTAYLASAADGRRDFLAVATPGAGKTTYALRVATELLGQGVITEVTVVAPTEHLKHQWADAAARVGLHLNPAFANSVAVQSREYGGVALTFAQVASRPDLHRRRTEAAKTLVILDEIHHGGDAKSWGDAIREAFEPATRRLALTGTPFRSDTSPIRSCAMKWTRGSCARPPTTLRLCRRPVRWGVACPLPGLWRGDGEPRLVTRLPPDWASR